ncbi:hypothetical protein Tco_0878845 [Tanacetum coccineum]|uniref:Uncharacterized protein n=1 Tax=Tanacetum coccineum TaxID=301880 RepID=A0ABQ5C4Y8_9ASTR
MDAQQPTPGFQSAVSGRTTMENLSINVHTYPSVDQATWELSTIDNLNSRDIGKQETINNALHVAVNKGQIEMVNASSGSWNEFSTCSNKIYASYVVEASSSIRSAERGMVNKEPTMASQPLDPIDTPAVDTDAQTRIR